MPKTKAAAPEGRSLATGMLSFARSVQPSEGLFWGTRSGDPDHRQPIEVVERGVRGQSSEYKTDNPGKSNPQVVEAAFVPPGCDGVELSFGLWVTDHTRQPWACDEPSVGQTYRDLVAAYGEKGGFGVLARGLAWNMANARFAWRNRFLADHMRVHVAFDDHEGENALIFDPSKLSLNVAPGSALPTADELYAAVATNEAEHVARVDALLAHIEKGLRRGRSFLEVSWRAAMPEAQEVFPSQEYLRDEKREGAPSRVYAKLGARHAGRTIQQASMHSQKIGAALRHLDVWHGSGGHGAVPVNPYAGVQETGEVLRPPSEGRSLYGLRKRSGELFAGIEDAQSPDDIPGQVHFVVANLVRGGVFGERPS